MRHRTPLDDEGEAKRLVPRTTAQRPASVLRKTNEQLTEVLRPQANMFQVNFGCNSQSVTSSPVQVSFNSTAPQPEEGAFVWKHGSFYYLFFSSGVSPLDASC